MAFLNLASHDPLNVYIHIGLYIYDPSARNVLSSIRLIIIIIII